MDTGRNDLLGELASDAALERSDFLVQSTDQLRRFLDRHKDRIAAIGGLTLIDEDPDYLSIAPDLSFRSRSRYQDELTGEWISETEIIETAAELVELYNPADVYAAFAEAAKEAAGFAAEPTASDDLMDAAGIAPEESMALGEDPYAAAADSWAASRDSIRARSGASSLSRARVRMASRKREKLLPPLNCGAPANQSKNRSRCEVEKCSAGTSQSTRANQIDSS